MNEVRDDDGLSSDRNDGRQKEVYNLGGQQLSHCVRGINIIRNAGGLARKIFFSE